MCFGSNKTPPGSCTRNELAGHQELSVTQGYHAPEVRP
jgi:hypothetical protein